MFFKACGELLNKRSVPPAGREELFITLRDEGIPEGFPV
jgi:hypothetical protein